ncbi:MAG TPA: hypothetical protein VMF56_09300 [Acidobacteriaceae bacterium]|nr:hypothetical protein [Acidobacteriaceae bacterium]
MMKRRAFLALCTALIVLASAKADTLRLRSGVTVQGTFLGADTRQMTFVTTSGQTRTYLLSDVSEITFTPPPPPPPPPPPVPHSSGAQPANVTLLAGTLIPVRLVNGLSTSTNHTGDRFTAILDSNLVANGVVVASRGATLHGIVTKAEHARRLTGRSELQIALTDIVINGAAQQISTNGFQQKGSSEGANTAKKTAAGAGLGAAIGAIGGNAGRGAAIGAVSGVGVSMIKKGEAIVLPAQTLLEFSLAQPTILPVQH